MTNDLTPALHFGKLSATSKGEGRKVKKEMNKLFFDTNVETDLLEEVLTKQKPQHCIVIYNDDHNTFDHVIECLIHVCKHQTEQAVQCTYLIHYKGKCAVKQGSYKKLEPLCSSLLQKGLTAKIEEV